MKVDKLIEPTIKQMLNEHLKNCCKICGRKRITVYWDHLPLQMKEVIKGLDGISYSLYCVNCETYSVIFDK